MKQQNIEDVLSHEELKEYVRDLRESVYFDAYVMLQNKLRDICLGFEQTSIDVSSDEDQSFKNLITFGKSALSILTEAEAMFEKMSVSNQKLAKEARMKKNDVSLESMLKKIK